MSWKEEQAAPFVSSFGLSAFLCVKFSVAAVTRCTYATTLAGIKLAGGHPPFHGFYWTTSTLRTSERWLRWWAGIVCFLFPAGASVDICSGGVWALWRARR